MMVDITDINELLARNEYNCYAYGQSVEWAADSKVNRYKGIWKKLDKSTDIELIDFALNLIETQAENESGQIKTYGLLELKAESLIDVLRNIGGIADCFVFLTKRSFDEEVLRANELFSGYLSDIDLFSQQEKTRKFELALYQDEFYIFPIYINGEAKFELVHGKRT
ncbi:hypothetical protein CWB99_07995 [Pseudoalteromonas rubra]|uniref:Uncharacterized protein n=1 Tax=Pseudoalteromonas rubra TaxID=43658 RepID=A0A5S3WP51_9GAMM|nr:hypothetical protein [Pseudoalteromonas rubra]TMP29541.1 hypothetical protein CWB99_07995 [Pseudoalteromonas rubra]TMP35135.1 hypothetical protein CWC00_04960 [Pseudoalteromonas rubra]